MTTLGTLLEDLNSEDTRVYRRAKDQLRKIGRMAIPGLANMMLSRSERPAWRAASLLAGMHDANTTFAFLKALKSTSPVIRQTAARYLSKYGDKTATSFLINSLNDEDRMVQIWVIEALGNFGDKQVVPSLLALLDKTTCASVQHSVIRALGRIGDRRALGPLSHYFNSNDYHVRTRAQEVYVKLSTIYAGV